MMQSVTIDEKWKRKEGKKKKKNGGLEEGGCVGRKENPPGN